MIRRIETVHGDGNRAGRRDKVSVRVPEGVTYRSEPERSRTLVLFDAQGGYRLATG